MTIKIYIQLGMHSVDSEIEIDDEEWENMSDAEKEDVAIAEAVNSGFSVSWEEVENV